MTEQQIRQFLRDEMRVVQAERQDAFCEMLQKFLEYQKDYIDCFVISTKKDQKKIHKMENDDILEVTQELIKFLEFQGLLAVFLDWEDTRGYNKEELEKELQDIENA